jgi:hypothetical protein
MLGWDKLMLLNYEALFSFFNPENFIVILLEGSRQQVEVGACLWLFRSEINSSPPI